MKLQLSHSHGESVTVSFRNVPLFRYVYQSEVGIEESPKPYFHPVRTLSGNCLTNFRPNDHPWHHALCHTITRVGEANFWGGPSYRQEGGYQFRGDNGRQVHREWANLELTGDGRAVLDERLDWATADGRVLLAEARGLTASVAPDESAWTLGLSSTLKNTSGGPLDLGNYHSSFGLKGSHYTGWLMRLSRDYLFCDFDSEVGLMGEGGLSGVDQVHGAQARWVALAGRHDTTLDRTTTIFVDDSPAGPVHWFVRDKLPAVGFSFQHDRDLRLEAGAELKLRHRLIFAEGALKAEAIVDRVRAEAGTL